MCRHEGPRSLRASAVVPFTFSRAISHKAGQKNVARPKRHWNLKKKRKTAPF
jgi:hypothetical protein